jgi:hypothetical protein
MTQSGHLVASRDVSLKRYNAFSRVWGQTFVAHAQSASKLRRIGV